MPSTNKGSTIKLAELFFLFLFVFELSLTKLITFLGKIESNSILFFSPNSPNLASKVSKSDVPLIISVIISFSLFNLSNF